MANPTAIEQLTLEYINLLRTNPSGEYGRLINSALSTEITGALNFFGVSLSALQGQLSALIAVAPLAWNDNLNTAARIHNDLMIQFDQQSHQLPGEAGLGARITAAGYTNWSNLGENVFAFSTSAFYGHAGFVIDWGYDDEDFDASGNLLPNWETLGDGIQDPPGHRISLMSANFTEIGVSITSEANPSTKVGPLVTTHELGNRFGYKAQFVGVVIDDRDNDNFYDIGEGMGNVTVTLTSGASVFTTTSWESGGWQIAVPAGTYTLVFSGGSLNGTVTRTATIGAANVKVDAEAADAVIAPFTGTQGDDTITGNSLANTLLGLGGNDILIGAGGSDILDGGTGFDEARYAGSRKTYRVSVATESGGLVSRIAFGPEGGTDTLRSIEQARFTDGVLSFDPAGNAAKVLRMYDATLQRAPDVPGFEFWLGLLNGGTSLSTMAASFAGTSEFINRFGNLNNQQFVEQMYIAALGRPGDTSGVQFWTSYLNAGNSRGEVLREFSETGEHVTRTSGALAQGLWIADPSARVAARMYDAALDRLPDSAGLAAWTNALKGGTSVIDMAGAFAASQEFQARFGALTNQQFVEQLYVFALNRPGDSAGVQFWTSQLANGQSRAFVLAEFSETAEHVSNSAALWYNGISVVDGVNQSVSPATDGSGAFGEIADYDLDTLFAPFPDSADPADDLELAWDVALAAMIADDRAQPGEIALNNASYAAATIEFVQNSPQRAAFAPDLLLYAGQGTDPMLNQFPV